MMEGIENKKSIPKREAPEGIDIAFADSANKMYVFKDGVKTCFKTNGGAFDIYSLGNGLLAYGSIYDGDVCGLIVCDLEGNIKKRYETKAQVFGIRPFDGGFLCGELPTKQVVWLDNDLKVIRKTPVRYDGDNLHEVMRGVRLAKDGNILVAQPGDNVIRRYTPDGILLSEVKVGADIFAFSECENGNIINTQHDALVERDKNGNELRRIDNTTAPEAGLCWPLNFTFLPNGNLLLVNWLGHGCEGKGYPVSEYDKDWRLVGLYTVDDDAEYISAVTLL